MGKITLDEALRSKLNGLTEELEVCDETGRQVGFFLPRAVYQEMLASWSRTWVSDEELACLSLQTGGRPLAEIWKSLGRA